MLKDIRDKRILKKFAKYLGVALAIYGGAAGFILGGLWLSYRLFDNPFLFIIMCFGTVFLVGMFAMAREQVENERRQEQTTLDLLAAKLQADEERQKWNEEFRAKFGVDPQTLA